MGAALARRQLGRRMQHLRVKVAGKTREDVATSGIASISGLSRLEGGQVAPHWGKIRLLCELYGADHETTDRLIEMARAARLGDGWFERYGDDAPETLAMFIEAEQTAERVETYDPEFVPGAVQTADYTRAIFAGEKPTSSREHIDFLVDGRLERQDQFWTGRPQDAVLCIVVGEAALAREVGGRATIRRQVARLREVDSERGTEVRVLPWSAGGHPAIYGGFTLFRFADPDDPPVVFVESYTGGQYLEGDGDFRRMSRVWQRVYDLSIAIKEYQER